MAFNPREHLMDLKGKEYLQVMWRLVWFREDKPLWSIDTQLIEHDDGFALFRASIADETGAVKATAFGSETVKDFRDYIEKAETKAVGRALAMLGYGTQFTATELDECDRIVDSPVARPKAKPAAKAKEATKAKPNLADMVHVCADCGKEIKVKDIEAHVNKCLNKWGAVVCGECAKKRLSEADKKAEELAQDLKHIEELKREKVNKETA